jgi:hypothetical protein
LFKDRGEENEQRWKRMKKVIEKIIIFVKKESWKKFSNDLEESCKTDKNLIYRVLQKRRSKAEEKC